MHAGSRVKRVEEGRWAEKEGREGERRKKGGTEGERGRGRCRDDGGGDGGDDVDDRW